MWNKYFTVFFTASPNNMLFISAENSIFIEEYLTIFIYFCWQNKGIQIFKGSLERIFVCLT